MSEEYNKNHAASIDYVNSAVTDMWEKMKVWVAENVDKSAQMGVVKEMLDKANRQVIGDTATEKAQALEASVSAIVKAMTDSGVDMEGVTTAQIAQYITTLSDGAGVWIEDTDGVRWTAEQWAYEKQQRGGVDPAVFQGIVLANSSHEFYIASKNYGTSQFGAYNHTIPSLQTISGGPGGTPVDGEINGRRILAATDPDRLRRHGFAIDYYDGLDYEKMQNIDVVFFPDQDKLTSWANQIGFYYMSSLGASKIYAIPHADGTSWVLKYFNGTSSITFGTREAQAPYIDTQGQRACVPANFCDDHREYDDDNPFWRLPSLFELLMMYLNKKEINACRSALGGLSLPSGNVWSCLQAYATGECCFSLADGSWISNYGKNGSCGAVPVASRRK